jgi:hypothetical protein
MASVYNNEHHNEHLGSVKAASGINFLAGLWLFITPWVFGAYMATDAWNAWIIGAIIAILALIRFSNPALVPGISWINCILAIWTFISPWIYGYTGNSGRFLSSLVVGVVVFVLSIRSAMATPRNVPPMTTH